MQNSARIMWEKIEKHPPQWNYYDYSRSKSINNHMITLCLNYWARSLRTWDMFIVLNAMKPNLLRIELAVIPIL